MEIKHSTWNIGPLLKMSQQSEKWDDTVVLGKQEQMWVYTFYVLRGNCGSDSNHTGSQDFIKAKSIPKNPSSKV